MSVYRASQGSSKPLDSPCWPPFGVPLALCRASWAASGIPLGRLGLPWGVFWILLKSGRHFPSKCAKFTILLFKIKPPGILQRIFSDLPETVSSWAGQDLGSSRRGQGLREFRTNSLKLLEQTQRSSKHSINTSIIISRHRA